VVFWEYGMGKGNMKDMGEGMYVMEEDMGY